MRAGQTSEGYDLLAEVTLSDLAAVGDAERPEATVNRVRSIIERHPSVDAGCDATVMGALIRAAKRGDHDAANLLIFGDLEGDDDHPLS